MKKYYAGIGSRETPEEILELMTKIAKKLEEKGYILNSGGADGADAAFAKEVKNKQIFIPWEGFNGIEDGICDLRKEMYELAENMHPAWDKCSDGAKKLHARNTQQVLGRDLKTPVKFVICYTKDGKKKGGTATAIKLAENNNIPVTNLGIKEDLEKALKFIED
jgi:hypothetical protein